MEHTRTMGRSAAWLRRGVLVALLVLAPAMVDPMPSAAASAALEVPVLMYHRITKAPPDARLPGLWVAPHRFRAHMRALYRRGWRTITARELSRAVALGRTVGHKRFVVTFDDGARDGYRRAAPILERYGMRGTFCVTPGRAHKPWQISFKQMRRLREVGHEIANHSLTHADLPRLGARRLRRQVEGARRLIGSRIGQVPTTFCYPFGRQDARVRQAVLAAGHRIAFTTVDGARQSRNNRLQSPRIRVNGWDSAATLVARMRPYARGSGPEQRPVFQPANEPISVGSQAMLRSGEGFIVSRCTSRF